MLLFVLFQFIVVFEFILVLRQTLTPDNYWYTWICFGKFNALGLFQRLDINTDIVVLGMVFALVS